MRVYIKRCDLIGRYGVMTTKHATVTFNKRSFVNVKLTLPSNRCYTSDYVVKMISFNLIIYSRISNYTSFIRKNSFHHVTHFSKFSFVSFGSFPGLLCVISGRSLRYSKRLTLADMGLNKDKK